MVRRRATPAPMLATLGPPPAGDQWAVEWKFDGQRANLIVDRGEVVTFSRNGADVSLTFPEMASVGHAVGGRSAVLDGEIVALDAQGRPSFTRLQRRWPQQRRPKPDLLRSVPVQLIAFCVRAVNDHAGPAETNCRTASAGNPLQNWVHAKVVRCETNNTGGTTTPITTTSCSTPRRDMRAQLLTSVLVTAY